MLTNCISRSEYVWIINKRRYVHITGILNSVGFAAVIGGLKDSGKPVGNVKLQVRPHDSLTNIYIWLA